MAKRDNKTKQRGQKEKISNSSPHDEEVDSRDEQLLRAIRETEVEKEDVVSMVEGLVDVLGRISGQSSGVSMPRQSASSAAKTKTAPDLNDIAALLEETGSSAQLRSHEGFMDWLRTEACKQKKFDEELRLIRRTIDIAGENNDHDLGILAASRAVKLAHLHAKSNNQLLSELFWLQADLYALAGRMTDAFRSLRQCIALADPDADEDSAAYIELARQLEESKIRGQKLRESVL